MSRNRAIVAVARKLPVLLYRIWVTQPGKFCASGEHKKPTRSSRTDATMVEKDTPSGHCLQ
jgi:hypothetical protein